MDAGRAAAMVSTTIRPARAVLKITSMASQKPAASSGTRRGGTTVFPLGEPGPRQINSKAPPPVKLLTNVEKLRLLTKAEKAGLLSAAENAGLSLSAVERLGLLSKAEELEVLSAATDPGTPAALLSVGVLLLVLGPALVYFVPEEYPWQVALQAVAAVVSVVGGSAALAASSFVSRLQSSSS